MRDKSDFEVLDQRIDDEKGQYRLRVGDGVFYVTIPAGVFDNDTMSHPDLLIPNLPDLPGRPWPRVTLYRDEDDDSLTATTSAAALPEIQKPWHDTRVDVLSLPRVRRLGRGAHEVVCDGIPAVAKIACFEEDFPRVERETWAYSVIERYRAEHTDEDPIAPSVFGHVTEGGRVVGILLERIEGEPAGLSYLAGCESVHHRLHRAGLTLGGASRSNNLVERASRRVRLVGLENALAFTEKLGREELASLSAKLAMDE